jgi:hypothetical protein
MLSAILRVGFAIMVLMLAARVANAVSFQRHAHPGATGGNHRLWSTGKLALCAGDQCVSLGLPNDQERKRHDRADAQ